MAENIQTNPTTTPKSGNVVGGAAKLLGINIFGNIFDFLGEPLGAGYFKEFNNTRAGFVAGLGIAMAFNAISGAIKYVGAVWAWDDVRNASTTQKVFQWLDDKSDQKYKLMETIYSENRVQQEQPEQTP